MKWPPREFFSVPISDGTIGLSIMTLANVRRKVGVVMGNLSTTDAAPRRKTTSEEMSRKRQ